MWESRARGQAEGTEYEVIILSFCSSTSLLAPVTGSQSRSYHDRTLVESMIIYRMAKFKSAESPQWNSSATNKASNGQWWNFELCDTSATSKVSKAKWLNFELLAVSWVELLFWHPKYDHWSSHNMWWKLKDTSKLNWARDNYCSPELL